MATEGMRPGGVVAEVALGEVRLTLLLDARGTISGDRVFSPASREEWGVGLKVGRDGEVPIQVTCLLIRAGERCTLVDTGFGDALRTERRESVLESLAAAGVQPRDVERVILTHAHGDHAAGNTLHRGNVWVPTFPLAEYVVQEREVAAMRAADDPFWRTRFQPLVDRGQLRMIDGDVSLGDSLACRLTPGHTIGHQSVVVSMPEGEAVFLGDLAVLAKNLERPEWNPSWAWSIAADIASRRAMIDWAAKTAALVIVGHDPERPVVRVAVAGGTARVTAATVDA
jgi:glyoxylase-like metal-dependent hydrolase (beta-lactamase superfamily II)